MKIIDVNENDIDGVTVIFDSEWILQIRYSASCCEDVHIEEGSVEQLKKLIGAEVSDNITKIVTFDTADRGMINFNLKNGDTLPLEIEAVEGCGCYGGVFTIEYIQDISEAVDWE